MKSGRVVEMMANTLDRLSRAVHGKRSRPPEHIETGQAGERAAYFFLRRLGYTIVARNWRTRRRHGELDIVGWDDGTLCFVEVKTRSSRTLVPAEFAVNRDKQRQIVAMAYDYMHRIPSKPPFRFDIVSVYIQPGCEPELHLFKNAFYWGRMAR